MDRARWMTSPLTKSAFVKFRDFDEAQYLCCPRCGGGWLHHRAVLTFEPCDRGTQALRIRVKREGVSFTHIHPQDGIRPQVIAPCLVLEFWCERCGPGRENRLELTLQQDNGATEVSWRFP
jgi:hypothetical protein